VPVSYRRLPAGPPPPDRSSSDPPLYPHPLLRQRSTQAPRLQPQRNDHATAARWGQSPCVAATENGLNIDVKWAKVLYTNRDEQDDQELWSHSANERTFLAWVRTAIAVMAFGFIVEKFDLFLDLAAPSLAGRTLSLPGQKFGKHCRIGPHRSRHCDGCHRSYPLSDHREENRQRRSATRPWITD
jgi:hypothetical protein